LPRRHKTKDQKRVTGGIPDPNSLNEHWGALHARPLHDLLKRHSLLWQGAHFRTRFSSSNRSTRFQAYWELYLYDVLYHKNLHPQLHAKDQGPDFKCTIENDDVTLWVEAVAPSFTEPANEDCILKALANKHAQLNNNKDRNRRDLCVIAINTALSKMPTSQISTSIAKYFECADYNALKTKGDISGILLSNCYFDTPQDQFTLPYVPNPFFTNGPRVETSFLFDILH